MVHAKTGIYKSGKELESEQYQDTSIEVPMFDLTKKEVALSHIQLFESAEEDK
jgi:hypothetical protein